MVIEAQERGILAHSGGNFFLLEPEKSTFAIRDIALALSNICRFTGHTKRFYSVAEHSVWCSHIVPDKYALDALMHDATEAFVGDVAKPLKDLLPDYAAIEERAERAIFDRFGVTWPVPDPVKAADMAMLAAEKVQALDDLGIWPMLSGIEPAEILLQFWTPDKARRMFLRRFRELAG